MRPLLACLLLLASSTSCASTPGARNPGVESESGVAAPRRPGSGQGVVTPSPRPAATPHHASRDVSRLDVLDWHALAMCESTDRRDAVSPSGKYRGLYQFDRETWASVGGTGDPAEASREEQDYRALVLFMRRGTAPWPECGHHLTRRRSSS